MWIKIGDNLINFDNIVEVYLVKPSSVMLVPVSGYKGSQHICCESELAAQHLHQQICHAIYKASFKNTDQYCEIELPDQKLVNNKAEA